MKRIALLALLLAASASAQSPTRRATNVGSLLAHPEFFHQRAVVVVGTVALQNSGEMRVTADGGSIRLIYKGNVPDGPAEIRGEFWDVGRMNSSDPRLTSVDPRTFGIDPDGAWPRPGTILALVGSAISPAAAPASPSIRNVVLYPTRWEDQKITVTGQFAGRNLLGDLPDAPGKSRYDFVIRSADAAIWVTNLRPRGRDFELSLDTRIDTGRWVEISGTVQQGRGLQWLDATTAGSIKITTAPKETLEDEPIRVPLGPPPEVVFSAPIEGETDVMVTTNVRIQFSRDINPTTLRNHVQVKYSEAETPSGPRPGAPVPEFTTQYLPGTRVLEIKFAAPLERFRTVQVLLGEGIVGTDGQALKPWILSFLTGA